MAEATIEFHGRDRTQRAFNSLNSNMKRLDDGTKKLTRALGALGGAFAVFRLARFTNDALKSADALAKLSKQTGLSVEAIQKYNFAAEQSGVSQASFNSAVGAFGKRIGELRAGTGSLFTLLNKTDKAFLEQLKTTTNLDDAFLLLSDKVKGTALQTDRMALSAAAFGRGLGLEMLQVVQQGSDEIKNLGDQLGKTGAILGKDGAAAAERANDAMNLLSRTVEGLTIKLIVGLAPAIEAVTGWLQRLFNLGERGATQLIERIGEIKGKIDELEAAAGEGLLGKAGDFFSGDMKKLIDLKDELSNLETELYDVQRRGKETAIVIHQVGDAAGDAAGDVYELSDAFKDALKDVDKELQEGARIIAEYENRSRAVEKVWGQIGEKTGGALGNTQLAEANARLREMHKEIETGIDLSGEFQLTWEEITRDTIRGLRDAWADFFYDVFQGKGLESIGDFLETVKNMFLRIIAEIAAAWATAKVFSFIPGFGGSVGGILTGGGLGGGAATLVGSGAATGVTVSALAPAAAIPAGTSLGVHALGGVGAGGLLGGSGSGGAIAATGIEGAVASGTEAGIVAGAPAWAAYLGPAVVAAGAVYGVSRAFKGSVPLDEQIKRGLELGPYTGVGRSRVGFTNDEAFARYAGGRGAKVDTIEGLGSRLSVFGTKEEEFKGINELRQEFEKLQELLPKLASTAEETFSSMGISAEQFKDVFSDGVLTPQEQAQLGFVNMGNVSAEQFNQIVSAIAEGKLSLTALTGETRLTAQEIVTLGQIGITNLENIRDGVAGVGQEMKEAESAAQSLASAIRAIPSPPSVSGDLGNHKHGADMIVPGSGSGDRKYSIGLEPGERLRVLPRGRGSRRGGDGQMDQLISGINRLVARLEAAA